MPIGWSPTISIVHIRLLDAMAIRSLSIEQPRYAARHKDYPVQKQATIHQYAADYILLEGEGDLTIEFAGKHRCPLGWQRGTQRANTNGGQTGVTTATSP